MAVSSTNPPRKPRCADFASSRFHWVQGSPPAAHRAGDLILRRLARFTPLLPAEPTVCSSPDAQRAIRNRYRLRAARSCPRFFLPSRCSGCQNDGGCGVARVVRMTSRDSLFNSGRIVVSSARRNRAQAHGGAVPHINPWRKPRATTERGLNIGCRGQPLPRRYSP